MSTPQERQRVAKELRGCSGFMYPKVGMADLFDELDPDELADLIDPTCHCERHCVTAEELGRAHGLQLFVCSECGQIIEERREHARPFKLTSYCPGCGARIEWEGDDE